MRNSKAHKAYHGEKAKKARPKGDCPLCTNVADHTEHSTDNFLIVKNIFPYSYWDMQGVTEHLMLIPKKHIKQIKDLPTTQRTELINLVAEYGKRGYNQYSRGNSNALKSIPGHLHIHLIQLDEKLIRRMVFTSKPYMVRAKQ